MGCRILWAGLVFVCSRLINLFQRDYNLTRNLQRDMVRERERTHFLHERALLVVFKDTLPNVRCCCCFGLCLFRLFRPDRNSKERERGEREERREGVLMTGRPR